MDRRIAKIGFFGYLYCFILTEGGESSYEKCQKYCKNGYKRYNNNMEFEYDSAKSEINQQKHGISFEEAKALWTVPGITLMAKNRDEVRFMRVGLIEGKCFTCFFTMRNIKVRLISVRRSRENEVKEYQRRVEVYEKKEENHGS